MIKKLLCLLCLILPCAIHAAEVPPIPTPDEEKAQFELADGFQINLFAADPLLDKPIQMNFDPAGRLWVASSETYPQIKPGSEADDRIVMLEDDGTGHAKSAKVFVDHLLIPTSVIFGHGGVYVANSTELLHYDEGPDGKAVNKRIVLSGFGTEDTHHILHTLRWGPDGRLYLNQSVYIHSHIETPWGVKTLLGGGIWRFEPSSMKLEVFLHGMWNTWGHAFDDFGQSIGTDGAGTEGINFNVQGAYYPAAVGSDKILHGLNPGSPKYAGCEILGGRSLPADWQGLVLTNDFRASRVCRFQLSDDGSGFAAKQLSDVIKSKTNVFRPVDIKMGPDGAIFIADWCNPIINHGEVDFRDPRRDHTHGRIWRLTYHGQTLPKIDFVHASNAELMEDLKAPEPYTRQQVKRVLAERNPDEVFAAVKAYLAGLQANDPSVEHQKLEALWVYESIDHVDLDLLEQLLKSSEPRVRAAAVRVVAHWHDQLPDGPNWLAKAIADDFPRVRLEAIHALSQFPLAESEAVALQGLDKPRDRFIDYALWLTSNDLKAQWQPALEHGQLKWPPLHEAFALQSINSPEALKPLLAELAGGHMADEDRAAFFNLLTTAGTQNDCQAALDLAIGKSQPIPQRVELLNALSQAPATKSLPQESLAKVQKLFDANEAVRIAAVRLAGAAQVQSLRPALLELATSANAPLPVRRAAVTALGSLGGKPSVGALGQLSSGDQPIELRFAAVEALVPLDLKIAAARAVDTLASGGSSDPTKLFDAFLQHTGGDKALAAALANHKISPDAAKLGLRAVYQASRTDSPLLAALPIAGGIDAAPPPLTHEQMVKLMAEVVATGNPANGEQIFRRKELSCLQCHAIAGSGGNVAPDLLSLGASAPLDYIIDSVLLPNKVVKEGFNSLIITTKDAQQITGIRVRQSATELVLRDATHDEIPIAISNIKSSRDGGSIMPSGLTDMLTHQEFVDLIRFLSELGKGKYAAAGMPVARRWRLLDPPIAGTSATPAELNNNPSLTWIPMYSQVDGVLPIDPKMPGRNYLRTQLEVTTPGQIEITFNDPHTAVLAWMDNSLVEPKKKMSFDLPSGIHTLSLLIEAPRCIDGLKLELTEAPGSAAKAQFIGGK